MFNDLEKSLRNVKKIQYLKPIKTRKTDKQNIGINHYAKIDITINTILPLNTFVKD